MTLTDRDRRALKLGGPVILVAALTIAYMYLGEETAPGPESPSTATVDSVEITEQRLARLKDIAAAAPAKQEILKKVSEELAAREQGLIRAETVPQAQAQMIAILRELLAIEAPPIEIRSPEMAPVEALGDSYGLAPVRVQFECRVEQLLNVLAGLAARPEIISTRDFQILTGNPRQKTIRVTLTVVGVVPKELVPQKDAKGAAGL